MPFFFKKEENKKCHRQSFENNVAYFDNLKKKKIAKQVESKYFANLKSKHYKENKISQNFQGQA